MLVIWYNFRWNCKSVLCFQIPQLDGKAESSEDDDDLSDNNDDLDSDSDLNTDEEDALDDVGIEMEDPCSADDISDEEASDLYDTDNVVVCQYEKISRSRNKWKFVLKVVSPLFYVFHWIFQFQDGVMNLNGRDYVFQKANGEADW